MLDHLEVAVRWQDIGASWSLGAWDEDAGVGLRASGRSAESVAPVYELARSKFNRLAWWLEAAEGPGEKLIPLFVTRAVHPGLDRERQTLMILGRLLSDEPDLRQRLTDIPTVDRLLADIRVGSQGARGEKLHLRRGSVEVRTAMHVLGLVHAYEGRPIPRRAHARAREEAVDAVLRYIARNRYAHDVDIEPGEVADQLDREYFNVKPWPFHALVS